MLRGMEFLVLFIEGYEIIPVKLLSDHTRGTQIFSLSVLRGMLFNFVVDAESGVSWNAKNNVVIF